MNILVTGFEPFNNETINPSFEAVKRLPDNIEGVNIVKLEVPCVRFLSLKMISDAFHKHQPKAIIMVGQAGGRSAITIERIGINIDDYGIPDNEGNKIVDESIEKDGPAAYFSTLPIKAIIDNAKEKGIPFELSNSAGTFICNHVLYGMLHFLDTNSQSSACGFIHVPFLPEQVTNKRNMPSMGLDVIISGLASAIETIIDENSKN